jgi:hypothetical protein
MFDIILVAEYRWVISTFINKLTMNIEIPVEGEGLLEVELISAQPGLTILSVVTAFSQKTGIAVEELLIFEEDAEEPLSLDVVIDEGRANLIHHVHRAKEIEVKVYYNGLEAKKAFPPSARVQRVLAWAVKVPEFRIDPTIAPEMELALHNETMELPKRAHIGRYVKHVHHKLNLDLIRGVIPNG